MIVKNLPVLMLNYDGTPVLKNPRDKNDKTLMTLRDVLIDSLNLKELDPSTGRISDVDMKRSIENYEVSKKMVAGDEVDLTAEQIARIQKNMLKIYGDVITGQVFAIIEPK